MSLLSFLFLVIWAFPCCQSLSFSLSLTVFDKHPWRKGFLQWAISKSGEIKRAWVGSSKKPFGRSNNDNKLEMGLWRSSNHVLLLLLAARLLVSTVTAGCYFPGYYIVGEGDGDRPCLNAIYPAVLMKFSSYLKNKCFQDCWKNFG